MAYCAVSNAALEPVGRQVEPNMKLMSLAMATLRSRSGSCSSSTWWLMLL